MVDSSKKRLDEHHLKDNKSANDHTSERKRSGRSDVRFGSQILTGKSNVNIKIIVMF
jgi:hypothetical protein